MNSKVLPTVLRKTLPPNLEKIRNGHYTKSDYDYPIHLYLKPNDITVQQEGSEIVEYLRGKNVLVTGGTGFLGKLLIEKLLRSCKDIGKIYVIIRTKKAKDPQTRTNEFLDNWVFYKLSEMFPDYKKKVVGLSGDFELDGLGLSEESKELITNEVQLIYHGAATIRFDENLKKAVKINIIGTQEMIDIAKQCKHLEAFIHFSTAFSNCHESHIREDFYPPHLDPYKLIKVTENLSAEVIDKITPGLLGSAPNTYAFTKQIAEDVVRQEAIGLPACIHRPSIVIACAREPIRSWVDNIFGPVGLVQGAAMGLLHIMRGNPNGRCDMVPVDYVINSCIATSYQVAKERNLSKVPIFNYTTSNDNPLLWRGLSMNSEQGVKVGSTILLAKAFFRFTKCLYWFYFLNFLLHTIPAFIADHVAVLLGKKPLLGKAYSKINKFMSVLSHFTCNQWTYEYNNTVESWQNLNNIDKRNFPFDMSTIDWQDYFDTYLVAMREFLVKEPLDNLEAGRRWLKIINTTHYAVFTLLTVFSAYYLLNTIFFFIPVCIISVELYYLFTNDR
ncbi:fatty acyl-CoA reductase wat-like isoform X6 [Anthonomus grandis grandis]|uniref:fatty acyl-CoA reductase wat-like isoform X6 n=1 Tax=Anthonomus grandis grandis TaxID=2921223 RepID=UPI0021652918|nr:fatty acyl-CoA reductase wat-like isoform X6 [Anthonomus grandis grandis]